MKRKIKTINLKQAKMITIAATLVMSSIVATLQPVEAAYMKPIDYSRAHTDGDDNNDIGYIDYQTDTWLKAIYPDLSDKYSMNDMINFYKNILKKEIPNENKLSESKKGYFIYSNTTQPDDGTKDLNYREMIESYDNKVSADNDLVFYFQNLDPTTQYFPTLEFKVGSNICYVDGKQFNMEAQTIKNKEGKVLIPMGHLSTILETSNTGFNFGLHTDAAPGIAQLVSPIFTPQFQGFHIGTDGKISEAVKIKDTLEDMGPSYTQWTFDTIPIAKDNLLNGTTQINDVLYVPIQYIAQYTNAKKATWDAKKQVAKINGQYTKEAVPYGIFSQPGTKSEYDIYKDWEMVPQQPVASKF